MTQNMNRKHEKHTVTPLQKEVTDRLAMYTASLRRVYTAGGFLSNIGGTTWASSLRGDGFPRQCEHWLGMTARRCPLDKPGGMGIIVSVRGRCIRRSAPAYYGNLVGLMTRKNRHLAEWRFLLFSRWTRIEIE